MHQAGLFGLSEQLTRLTHCGDDPLETMGQVVDLEVFRAALSYQPVDEVGLAGFSMGANDDAGVSVWR